jgi:hypothetical protein
MPVTTFPAVAFNEYLDSAKPSTVDMLLVLAIISALSPEFASPPTSALRVVTEDAEAKSELVVVVKTSLAKASLTLTFCV